VAKRYLSTGAVMQFCACPYRYFLSTVKRMQPEPTDDMVWQILFTKAREAFYAHERAELAMQVRRPDDVSAAYDGLMDFAVSHAISRASRHVDHMDFEDIERAVTEELSHERACRERLCAELLTHRGLSGEALSREVAFSPEMVARRIVDYRHRIVGTVSLIARTSDGPVPVQFVPEDIPPSRQEELLSMTLKVNAVLVSFELGEDVPASAAYLARSGHSFYVPIDEENKEQVKSFRAMVMGCTQFSPNTSSCDTCHHASLCEYHDIGN
jgi:CRISPR/Cas system-associated exonuclease Cas4 (RecB family)